MRRVTRIPQGGRTEEAWERSSHPGVFCLTLCPRGPKRWGLDLEATEINAYIRGRQEVQARAWGSFIFSSQQLPPSSHLLHILRPAQTLHSLHPQHPSFASTSVSQALTSMFLPVVVNIAHPKASGAVWLARWKTDAGGPCSSPHTRRPASHSSKFPCCPRQHRSLPEQAFPPQDGLRWRF